MKTLQRLDSTSPRLAEGFRRANDGQRRRAVLATCLIAISRTQLHGDDVDAAVDLLRHDGIDELGVSDRLDSLAAQLDDQYFELSSGAENMTAEALSLFRKARAAAALAFALSPDTEQLHEALYEAIVASDNQADSMQAAEGALVGS